MMAANLAALVGVLLLLGVRAPGTRLAGAGGHRR